MSNPANTFREFLPAEDEGRVFGRMRRRILATLLRQMFSHSRFRVTLVVVLTSLLWGGMFWMFANGFAFLQSAITNVETYALAMSRVFGIFFLSLMVMLFFSSAIILYGSLFRSREIAFLLTSPTRTGRVFLHKFQEAIVLSSWGFVLLGSPILLAYGVVASAPWYYYVLLLPFLVAFLYIPVALGAIACLLVVRYFPHRILTVLGALVVALAAIGAWTAWTVVSGPRSNLLTPGWFQEILGRMQVSDVRLLPSWWLSTALLDMVDREWSESLLFLALTIANALFFRQWAIATAERVYRPAFSGLYDSQTRRKRPRFMVFDRIFSRLMRPFPTTVRLMTLKDLRFFRRDPMQWSQLLIFGGFLVFYFINIRPFTYDVSSAGWVNMISFLNLAVVGLALSTFTTRFIFPMISLEGRRFWILGQLGVRRDTILWGKFLFAAAGTALPCSGLVLLSDAMLRVSMLVVLSHQLTCLTLCLGLAGIAVGFGAWLPNLRVESPSQIAAGFGGTLTLVTSTLYILIMVLLTALPMHFYLAAGFTGKSSQFEGQVAIQSWLLWWLAAGTLASLVLGAVATLVPLRIGFRAFQKLEF